MKEDLYKDNRDEKGRFLSGLPLIIKQEPVFETQDAKLSNPISIPR